MFIEIAWLFCYVRDTNPSKNGRAFLIFPRKFTITYMMLGDAESLLVERPIIVCEPTCDAGVLILSPAEVCPPDVRRRLRVTAIDVNRTGLRHGVNQLDALGHPHAHHS